MRKAPHDARGHGSDRWDASPPCAIPADDEYFGAFYHGSLGSEVVVDLDEAATRSAERWNLAGSPESSEVELALRERVLDWSIATADVVPWERDARFDPAIWGRALGGR